MGQMISLISRPIGSTPEKETSSSAREAAQEDDGLLARLANQYEAAGRYANAIEVLTVLARVRANDAAVFYRLALLTGREPQLLQLLGDGLSNREIAERVGLEVKTVKNYVSALLAKLQLANRTQAAVLATQLRTGDGATCP